MTAYYNEIDPKAAAWLRELIKQGHIAPGDVDERSISDVTPKELSGYTQCHFFAGIGVWSHALRKSGWPDDRPVWTGSCPCQPFSSAGKRKGTSDERHLWPHWFHLISQCRPRDVFGEQVASKDGRAWFDTVQADMEALGFAVGAADLCAAGVGAPHIRQRLWFYGTLADTSDNGPQGRIPRRQDTQRQMVNGSIGRDRATQRVADTESQQSSSDDNGGESRQVSQSEQVQSGGGSSGAMGMEHTTSGRTDGGEHGLQPQDGGAMRAGHSGPRVGPERVADAEHQQHKRCVPRPRQSDRTQSSRQAIELAGLCADNTANPTNGYWRNADWLGCRDGKFRPVEPGTFPLVNGAAARVGRLRGYGNAIVAQVAQTFIEATQGE
jgi:DNA (cytosine-5)-methyltransferase 1